MRKICHSVWLNSNWFLCGVLKLFCVNNSVIYFCVCFSGYVSAIKQSKEYVNLKGPGISAKPENHLFFRKLGPIIKRTLEKCERENGFM